MRLSTLVFRTEREAPSDAQLISHQLLVRCGFIRQISSGIYSLTPLAMRSLSRIVSIVKEEMNRVGGQEVLLPVAQPSSLWEQSGRYDKIDASLARWKDRNGQNMVLAMTHEESATDLVRHFVHSYRQLPMMIYQVQTKYRDEARPRGGLVRLREFLMKDAYSFHRDWDSLNEFYDQMIAAYDAIYRRCGVNVVKVEADSGMMGGGVSHEFMFVSENGEDTLVLCPQCGYAANREVAVSGSNRDNSRSVTVSSSPQWHLFVGSTDEIILVATALGIDVNDVKLAHVVGTSEVRRASQEELARYNLESLEGEPDVVLVLGEWLQCHSADLVGTELSVVVDSSLQSLVNKEDADGDWIWADVHAVKSGHPCARCTTALETVRGIEVGNIFKLGTYYSQPMNALFTDADGSTQPVVMGCYGIGITRLLASIIEQNHDDRGIVWPEFVAPYFAHLVVIGKDDALLQMATTLYESLVQDNVLFDDRDATAGVKLTDADLLGLPYRITLSQKSLAAGGVEIRHRKTGQTTIVALRDVKPFLQSAQESGKSS